LLQTLAVLGREFSFGLVRGVTLKPSDDLNRMRRPANGRLHLRMNLSCPLAQSSTSVIVIDRVCFNTCPSLNFVVGAYLLVDNQALQDAEEALVVGRVFVARELGSWDSTQACDGIQNNCKEQYDF
jgi:hypothetical protein